MAGACAKANQLNRALSLIERMYKLEIKPDAATYDILMKVGRAAPAILGSRTCHIRKSHLP